MLGGCRRPLRLKPLPPLLQLAPDLLFLHALEVILAQQGCFENLLRLLLRRLFFLQFLDVQLAQFLGWLGLDPDLLEVVRGVFYRVSLIVTLLAQFGLEEATLSLDRVLRNLVHLVERVLGLKFNILKLL